MSVFNAYMTLSGAADATLVRDERLSRRTGYHVGGPADLVVLRPGAGLVRYRASDVEWGRHATSIPSDEVILEATFELAPGERAPIDAAVRAGLEAAGAVAGSRASCGPVFLDPPGRSAQVLLGSCDLAGATQGHARVSDEDANVVVNAGGASAADIVALMGRMHEAVWRRHGIDLACEVKFLGFGA